MHGLWARSERSRTNWVSCRRSLLPAAALLALCLVAPAAAAAAPAPRVVNGDEATDGEYPAQGFLGVDLNADDQIEYFCGGTLVGSRQFLTAARCTVNTSGLPLAESSFTVRLGAVDLTDAPADEYAVAVNEVHDDYVKVTGVNDVAMLTLVQPADYELMRVVDDNSDDALWAPGTVARVLGWGEIQGGNTSDVLLEGDVTILPDTDCTTGPFICAAGTPETGSKNPCKSDSGSPLLVSEGVASYALAGVFSGAACSTAGAPGRYARVGDGALNEWVHDRIPAANFEFNHAPRANEPVTLTSTSDHPEGADYFKTFRWDLDGDGDFDRSGRSVTTTFPTAGRHVVGIEASKAGGDKATAYFAFNVGADPNGPPPAQPNPTPTPPAATPKRAAFLATIHAAKRPKVRRGRFNISVRFARTAPAGVAVVEVFRGKRRIGIARARVRRGSTRRISVKLTPTGRRLLARSASRRLKVRVRVRVGRSVLRSKTLTVRR
jgi:hypothetical protein